ncbi:MAG: hypothetical protein K0B01_12335 [Syntrophobacterales bacterium]|nr:hypothetical protein [Syntrophobacterales bacterium]
MAHIEMKRLDSGDLFPKMNFNLTNGTSLMLPRKDEGTWCVLLVYRGRW